MIKNLDAYIEQLLSSKASVGSLEDALRLITSSDELKETLDNPNYSEEEKQQVIEELFAPSVKSFILALAKECRCDDLKGIIDKYIAELDKLNNVTRATVICTTPPTDEQLKGIVNFIKKETNSEDVQVDVKEDKSIVGGFIISVEGKEYDFSLKAKMNAIKEQLMNSAKHADGDNENVLAVLRKNVKDFRISTEGEEIGQISKVGDGIATVVGLGNAMYGEIVVFEDGTKGMVQNIGVNSIGCILFGSDEDIEQGTKIKRTYKKAGVPVGDKFIGRVVNALGEPIDGNGDIEASDYRAIEQPAPSIVERKSVSVPMETGILAIDSMFPIGRGQRELIIGDRQTGKTAIAVDTIINQKGKDCICIYNAIGQKASTVAKLVNTLQKNGAMDYTIIVCASASDSASLQYIAPYAATSMAEYFMYQGKDVLIVYDDLSKHAVAYRSISLLLGRPPGREAYPGDVFYLHSRLLERAVRMSEEYGGGSLTALPIIETQAGDVSAYIPTNVISITDGQIYLETEMFNSGFRPAVNAGLSVSRVGGAAQIKAMKKIAAPIRTELAQYRELASFAQFGSELDDDTKEKLAQGERIKEVLKQSQYSPMPVELQVIMIYVVTKKHLLDVPVDRVTEFEKNFIEFLKTNYPEIPNSIKDTKEISDETDEKLVKAINEFKDSFLK